MPNKKIQLDLMLTVKKKTCFVNCYFSTIL